MAKCLCGCMREVDKSRSRGERKLFFEDACKSRYNRQKKRVVSVSQAHEKQVKPIIRYPGAKRLRSSSL
jgi:hypothetical protein